MFRSCVFDKFKEQNSKFFLGFKFRVFILIFLFSFLAFLFVYLAAAARSKRAIREALRELNASVQADVDVQLGPAALPRCVGFRYKEFAFVLPSHEVIPVGTLDACVSVFDFLPWRTHGRYTLVVRTEAGDFTLESRMPKAIFWEQWRAILHPDSDKTALPMAQGAEPVNPARIRIPLADGTQLPLQPLPSHSLRRRADQGLMVGPVTPESLSLEKLKLSNNQDRQEENRRPIPAAEVQRLMKSYVLPSGYTQLPGRWRIPAYFESVVFPKAPVSVGAPEDPGFWNLPASHSVTDAVTLTLTFNRVNAGGLFGFFVEELISVLPKEQVKGLKQPSVRAKISGKIQLTEWGGQASGEQGRLSVWVEGLDIHIPGASPSRWQVDPVLIRAHYENGQLAFPEWTRLKTPHGAFEFKGQFSLFERNGRAQDLPARLKLNITQAGESFNWKKELIPTYLGCSLPSHGKLEFDLSGMTYDLHCSN